MREVRSTHRGATPKDATPVQAFRSPTSEEALRAAIPVQNLLPRLNSVAEVSKTSDWKERKRLKETLKQLKAQLQRSQDASTIEKMKLKHYRYQSWILFVVVLICIGIFCLVASVLKQPSQKEFIQREERNVTQDAEIGEDPR